MSKIILDLCGGTGSWSNPYREAGYDVRLVTLPDQDVRLFIPPAHVHGILAAPPCTEFSFAKHYHGKGNYSHNFKEGLSVVDACLRIVWLTNPEWWALENPRGYLQRFIGPCRYEFDPWEHGDPYKKKTQLWGNFTIPSKQPVECETSKRFSQLLVAEIPGNGTGLTRQERRAITPQGFARAFFEANP